MSTDTIDYLKCQKKRKMILREIEELRSSKVLVYVSQAPLDDTVLMPIYQELCQIDRIDRLDLILNSYGGNIDTPYKIVKMIRGFCREFTVIVPVAAKSAASMIALGADQIIMGPFAELGPIDPVVRHPFYPDTWISAQSLQYSLDVFDQIIDQYTHERTLQYFNLFERIDPWLLGDYSKMVKASEQYACLLLKEYMFKDRADEVVPLVEKLINGFFSHGYPITKDEALSLGLNVAEESGELDGLILELYMEYDKLFRL